MGRSKGDGSAGRLGRHLSQFGTRHSWTSHCGCVFLVDGCLVFCDSLTGLTAVLTFFESIRIERRLMVLDVELVSAIEVFGGEGGLIGVAAEFASALALVEWVKLE